MGKIYPVRIISHRAGGLFSDIRWLTTDGLMHIEQCNWEEHSTLLRSSSGPDSSRPGTSGSDVPVSQFIHRFIVQCVSAVPAGFSRWEFGADAVPEAEAEQFVTCLEAEQSGVYGAPMTNDEATQHLYLLRFAGGVSLKWNMLGKLLDGLPIVVLLLRLWHGKKMRGKHVGYRKL
jgi:hypothetical protein